MRLPVKDRTAQPYMTEREIPAVKAALSAWRKMRKEKAVRKDKTQMQLIRDRAGIVAAPRTTAKSAAIEAAWNLEFLSQLEERIKKETESHD